MQTLSVSLELRDSRARFNQNQQSASLQRIDYYRLKVTDRLLLDVLTDTNGKLIYVRVPSQHSEVVREEFAGSIQAFHASIDAQAPHAQIDYSAPANASLQRRK
jgi:hypothetical protein